MVHIKMKTITTYLLLIFSVFTFPSYAEECMVSTDTRSIMKSHPDLQSEKIIEKDGQYSAVLNNGDIVLAKFSTCSLGMSAHYFSVKKLSNSELLERIKMFLGQAVASKDEANKALPQLDGYDVDKFKDAVVLTGLGSQHQLIVKPSASTIYKQHIQYDWIPPEF